MRGQFKSITAYILPTFFNAVISFATFSLLTRHLSEVDYGIINLYSSFIVFLSPFIGIGVQYTLTIDFFKLSYKEYCQHFTNALFIPLGMTIVAALLFLVLHGTIGDVVKVNLLFVFLLPFVSLMTILSDIFIALIRNTERPYFFAGFSIGKNVLEVSLTILFVIFLSYNWEGRLGSIVIALTVATLIFVWFGRKWKLFAGRFDFQATKKIFRTGLPFIPERLAIFVLWYSDRFFIDYFGNTAEVGYYSAGAQLSMIVYLAILALSNAFIPQMYKQLSQTVIPYHNVRRSVLTFISILVVLCISIMIATPFFFQVFVGPAFQEGQQYSYLLVAGQVFWGIYNIFLVFLMNLKKFRLVMFTSIGGMALSIILNLLNISEFGTIGAAYTNIIVYVSMAVAAIVITSRFYNLKELLFARALPDKVT